MLLMQEPKLLLLDEPVAGMTDEETERTGELLNEAARQAFADGGRARHGFRRQHRAGGIVTVLHEGSVLAEGTMDAVQATTASSKSIWTLMMPSPFSTFTAP